MHILQLKMQEFPGVLESALTPLNYICKISEKISPPPANHNCNAPKKLMLTVADPGCGLGGGLEIFSRILPT